LPTPIANEWQVSDTLPHGFAHAWLVIEDVGLRDFAVDAKFWVDATSAKLVQTNHRCGVRTATRQQFEVVRIHTGEQTIRCFHKVCIIRSPFGTDLIRRDFARQCVDNRPTPTILEDAEEQIMYVSWNKARLITVIGVNTDFARLHPAKITETRIFDALQ
jgi:hypothetical protein